MASTAPPGFIDLYTATSQPNREVNIMGVVTDILPPSRSRGTDLIYTFSIADSTLGGRYDQGLKVRFFKSTEDLFPKIQGTGDVVVLKNIKITQWNGMAMAISSRNSTWAVFPANSIPEKAPSNNIQIKPVKEARASIPSPDMVLYAVSLCNFRDRSSFTITAPTPPVTPQVTPQAASTAPTSSSAGATLSTVQGRRDKFALIKDVVIDVFYDVVGQVIKIFPANGCVELYISDYTSNSLLYNYEWGQGDGEALSRDGDEYGYAPRTSSRRKWPGPFGKMTLTVTLWPPHSYFAQGNVKELDFVFLRNMRVKQSRDAKLEGSLHSDRRWPDRVDITVLDKDDDRVKDVLRRKLDYTRRFKAQSQAFIEEVRGQKRKLDENDKPLSKTQAKKMRKQEREKTQKAKKANRPEGKENENAKSTRSERHNTPNTSPPPVRPPKFELNKNSKRPATLLPSLHHVIFPLLTRSSPKTNIPPSPKVKSSHPNRPLRPLSSILSLSTHALTTPSGYSYTLPFQNTNSRTTARIVNFFPTDLEDFAVKSRKPSEYDVLSDRESDAGSSSASPDDSSDGLEDDDQTWEWRFALILEDATTPAIKGEPRARITAYVANEDAEFLLKLDAENLRANPQALAALKEKLFLLWGDLEERKRAQVAEGRTAMKQIEANEQDRGHGEVRGSKPFECCLKEYGVWSRKRKGRVEGGREGEAGQGGFGWERRWRMWGTTIV